MYKYMYSLSPTTRWRCKTDMVNSPTFIAKLPTSDEKSCAQVKGDNVTEFPGLIEATAIGMCSMYIGLL